MARTIARIGTLKGFTMKCAPILGLTLLSSLFIFCNVSRAQSMSRFTLDGWQDNDIAETLDHPIIALGGHVNNDSTDTQMFHWDSYGRVRINRDDPDAPFFGYRVLFIDASTHSQIIHSSMDEFDLALGLHLGQIGDWDLSTMLGAGYSSTHPLRKFDRLFRHRTSPRRISLRRQQFLPLIRRLRRQRRFAPGCAHARLRLSPP